MLAHQPGGDSAVLSAPNHSQWPGTRCFAVMKQGFAARLNGGVRIWELPVPAAPRSSLSQSLFQTIPFLWLSTLAKNHLWKCSKNECRWHLAVRFNGLEVMGRRLALMILEVFYNLDASVVVLQRAQSDVSLYPGQALSRVSNKRRD